MVQAKYRRMTKEDDQYVIDNYENKSYKEMAENLGLNLRQIQHAMYRLDLQKNVWSINHYKQLSSIYKNQIEDIITQLENLNDDKFNQLINDCKNVISQKTLEEVGQQHGK